MGKRLGTSLVKSMRQKATNSAKQGIYMGIFRQEPPKNKKKVKAYT